MHDSTENARREMVADLNGNAGPRQQLEAKYGQVWDTDQLREDFEVQGFGAPFVVVRRKMDGKRGSLMFQNHPRFYFSFSEG